MYLYFLNGFRFGLPIAAALLLCTAAAAQPSAPPTLAEALDAAWALSSPVRAQGNRLAELDARQRATQSLLAAPPSLTLSQRSDQVGSRTGLREYEAGIALPLWQPGVRAATRQQVLAERAAQDTALAGLKLKLAGELRELLASNAQALVERAVALRKSEEARVLLQDVERRVQSGDAPRIDALQAQAAERSATLQIAQTNTALAQLQGQWQALTGLTQIATQEEAPGTAPPVHPAAVASQAAVQTAQAKRALAAADRADPLELGVAATRERGTFGDITQNALRLSLRIPFGGDSRNAARLAAALAELDMAQAENDATERQIRASIGAALAATENARSALALANERAALSSQAHALIAKSYRLGESDLPTRLRFEAEKFEAELALARAIADAQRAVSRLNQAYGLLP